MKSPSSGSGHDADQPDFLMNRSDVPGPAVAVEAKTTKKKAYTVHQDELDQLVRFAEGWGADPWLAIYFVGPSGGNVSYGGWWLVPVDEADRTDAGNVRLYRAGREEAYEDLDGLPWAVECRAATHEEQLH